MTVWIVYVEFWESQPEIIGAYASEAAATAARRARIEALLHGIGGGATTIAAVNDDDDHNWDLDIRIEAHVVQEAP